MHLTPYVYTCIYIYIYIQLELRKQDGSCQKIQDPREIKMAWKKVRGKMTKKCFEEDHLKVILTLLLKNI